MQITAKCMPLCKTKTPIQTSISCYDNDNNIAWVKSQGTNPNRRGIIPRDLVDNALFTISIFTGDRGTCPNGFMTNPSDNQVKTTRGPSHDVT